MKKSRNELTSDQEQRGVFASMIHRFSAILLLLLLVPVSSLCLHHPSDYTGKTPLGLPWQGPPIIVSKKIHDTKFIEFVEHDGWLGMQLDYKYVEPLVHALNTTEEELLLSRGEAHITVITPPEFSVLATANVTLDEINAIALDHDIQSTKFRMICLGKESVRRQQQSAVVYQIIVSAPNLVEIRKAVFRRYFRKGGNPALFDPLNFRPHITLAFTVSDLFETDGVYKGLNVCYRPIKTVH